MSLFAAACGGTDAPACTFNSDCAAGRYCTASGTCTADCTTDSECVTTLGDGATCSSFGMCIAPPDGGPEFDAGGGMDGGDDAGRDAGVDAFDPRVACVIAGGTDADGDGFCATAAIVAERDCDDSRAAVHPGAVEVCTPQHAAMADRALDENCDGAIDEGCAWRFGRPHAVVTVHSSASIHEAAQLSADGLRMYLRGYDASSNYAVNVAARGSMAMPFGPPVVVSIAGVPGPLLGGLVVSPDELEIIVDDDRGAPASDLYRARRTSVSSAFGALAPIAVLNTADREYAPAFSHDGLELFFARVGVDGMRRLYRAVRPSLDAEFGAPVLLVLPGTSLGDTNVAVSPDRRTILFGRMIGTGSRIFLATRASIDTAEFGTPVEVTDLSDAGGSYSGPSWVDERTAEVFFISTRTWSPASYGVFRAKICRDGPCDEPLIDCATGVRSPDGLHCYFAGPAATGTNDEARFGCASRGAHLPTVHSEAERALLWSTFGGGGSVWLGGTDAIEGTWRWDWLDRVAAEDPEEPFIYAPWGAGEPNGAAVENCLILYGPAGATPAPFVDAHCEFSYGYACEDDVWPTW